MLAQPLSVLLTAFAAVAASSVGGKTEPGVRLTLMRPSNSTAMARLLSSSRPYLFASLYHLFAKRTLEQGLHCS